MTPEEMIKQIKLIINHHSCIECAYWIEGPPENRQQKCDKFKVTPPTRIIINGCEYFKSQIPF